MNTALEAFLHVLLRDAWFLTHILVHLLSFVHVEREISVFGCHTHSWYLVVIKLILILVLTVNECHA